MVVIIEVRFGLIWLDAASEVIVVATVPVIVVVIDTAQTPGPQICPSRQQPPEPMVSWIPRG